VERSGTPPASLHHLDFSVCCCCCRCRPTVRAKYCDERVYIMSAVCLSVSSKNRMSKLCYILVALWHVMYYRFVDDVRFSTFHTITIGHTNHTPIHRRRLAAESSLRLLMCLPSAPGSSLMSTTALLLSLLLVGTSRMTQTVQSIFQ